MCVLNLGMLGLLVLLHSPGSSHFLKRRAELRGDGNGWFRLSRRVACIILKRRAEFRGAGSDGFCFTRQAVCIFLNAMLNLGVLGSSPRCPNFLGEGGSMRHQREN